MDKKIAAFDLDGTLIDAYPAVAKTFNYALEKLGYPPVPPETIKRAVGGGDKDLAGKFVRKEDVPRLISVYRENHIRFFSEGIRLLDGTGELLSFLKENGLKVGLATNRAKFAVPALLEKLNIKQYFDIICTTDDVRNPKPHPDMLEKIMDFCNAGSRDDIFYVGDMDIDYFTGRNAGVDTYIVLTGSSPKETLEKLDDIKMFDSLITLKGYLEAKS